MAESSRRAASAQENQGAKGVNELLVMADLEQAATNFESAIRSYRQALDGDLAPAERSRALRGVGNCLERIGRWQEAQNLFEDAHRVAVDSDDALEQGRAQICLGKIHISRGAVDAAFDAGEKALALIDAKADPSARGFALNLLAHAHKTRGELDKSAGCLEQALAAFKGAGDIVSLSTAYNNLGLIYFNKCDWRQAQEYLQVASSLQAIEGDYPERRAGLHNLGLVHFKMGHWSRSRECFADALEISRQVNDPRGIVRGLLAIAGVDLVERRWKDALESLEQSLEYCSEHGYPRETALTYRSLGQLHQSRNELARARRCFEVSWRKAVEIAQEGDQVRELLRLRAELALAEGQVADATNLAHRAVEMSNRLGDRMEAAQAHATLGRVLLAEGNVSGYDSLVTAQEMLRRLDSPLPLIQTLGDEGRIRLERGEDLERAESVLVEALEMLQGLSLPEYEVEILLELSRVASQRRELDRAGDFLERARRLTGTIDSEEFSRLLAGAQTELETKLVETSVTNLGAFRTAGRLEEVVESRRPYAGKLSDVLEIMAQALEADGASLVFTAPDLPGATYRIGSGAAVNLARSLRNAAPEQPEILLDAGTVSREPFATIARDRKASSILVIPVYGNGNAAYLYLDRLQDRGHSSFGPSHLNLCLALVPQLEALVDRATLETASRTEEDSLRRRTFLADVVTQNPEMIEILKLVEKINRTELTVLLQGETGTGKTLIARAIHLSSHRAEGSFVTVDCAALPENLLESELFGYVKGAFTGASRDKKGLFEEADGGTIFLDEIGKAGLGVQRRLLHLLDKGEVRPVGSTTYRKLNVRVICATSKKDLLDDNESGVFIKDLYYRLNDIIIRVPSLRERPEDIPLLAEYFLETFNGQTGRNAPGFSRSAMQRMVRYDWPGNVRELEKVVRRAAILAEDGEAVNVDLLPREVLDATEGSTVTVGSRDSDLRTTVEDMEKRLVLEALEKVNWNKTRAAQELGLSRKGLKNKISRYGLTPPA